MKKKIRRPSVKKRALEPEEYAARHWIVLELSKYGTIREVAEKIGCAFSSLYQFANGSKMLGPELARRMWKLVNKDKIVVPEHVWLAAMIGDLEELSDD